MRTIHYIATRMVAWPIALLGIVFVHLGGGLIHTAAFVADIDVHSDEDSL